MLLIGCSVLSLLICLPLYLSYRKSSPVLGSCFRALATLCAFVPALVAALRLEPRCAVCAVALLLFTAADFVLEFRMIPALILVCTGELCFAFFFLNRFGFSVTCLICLVISVFMLIMTLYRWREPIGQHRPVFSLSGAILCLMLSLGISGGLSGFSLSGILFTAGCAICPIGRFMLWKGFLFPQSRLFLTLSSFLCVVSELLLGIACLFV